MTRSRKKSYRITPGVDKLNSSSKSYSKMQMVSTQRAINHVVGHRFLSLIHRLTVKSLDTQTFNTQQPSLKNSSRKLDKVAFSQKTLLLLFCLRYVIVS